LPLHDRLPSAATAATQAGSLLHRRDAKFAEIGVSLDEGLFTLRPQRLSGEFSSEFDTIRIATEKFAKAAKTFKHSSCELSDIFLI
jgi:hypothetical protein